jgi:UV excision repair protein RAD23
MISQNQDAFLHMMNEGMEGMEGMEGLEDPAGEYMTVHITPEEEEAVSRLASLGFDRNLALEAYFACDKNEEMAANYLFDMGGDP